MVLKILTITSFSAVITQTKDLYFKRFQTTRNLHQLNLEKLLFGDPDFSEEENISLFRAVRKYIKSANRSNTNVIM